MQIICIYAGISPYEQKLDYVFNVFKTTLNEVNMKVEFIDLTRLGLNYFNGSKNTLVENVLNIIKNSQGVVFAFTAQRLAPNGIMQVFLEHLDINIYQNILNDKPCMSIITSSDNSEYLAGKYLDLLINTLGGITLNNMLIGTKYLSDEKILDNKNIIERYAEEFYRTVRQNRKFFVSKPLKDIKINLPKDPYIKSDFIEKNNNMQNEQTANNLEENKIVRNLSGSQVADLYKKEVDNLSISQNLNNPKTENFAQNKMVSAVYEAYQNKNNEYEQNISYNENKNYNNYLDIKKDKPIPKMAGQEPKSSLANIYFEANKQREIKMHYNTLTTNNKEITNNSTKKINIPKDTEDITYLTKLLGQKYKEEKKEIITPSINTLRQRTQSIYHYFQPQMAGNVEVKIQISITGRETFSGFLVIKNGECSYTEGVNTSADVSIISDSTVWEEVLNSKCTLQKAFMLGRLKVKGNFVVISKFEQYFKLN